MSSPVDTVTARFAQIQANREAATAATRATADESRKKSDAAGAAVHAKVRSRLSALRRRAADRRDDWGRQQPSEELEIGVVDDDEEATATEAATARPVAPGDEELEGRDWLR